MRIGAHQSDFAVKSLQFMQEFCEITMVEARDYHATMLGWQSLQPQNEAHSSRPDTAEGRCY